MRTMCFGSRERSYGLIAVMLFVAIATATIVLIALTSELALAQSSTARTTVKSSHIETMQELLGRLTTKQNQQFDTAKAAFDAENYAEALKLFEALLVELPNEPMLSKVACETALRMGNSTLALELVKPVAQDSSDDWQAVSLLTRAYAETGDKKNRDIGMAAMTDLHKRGVAPSGLQRYTLERIKISDNALIIETSLEPWSPYKVHDLGQVFDAGGKIILSITLESSDADQESFRKEHAKEADAGMRRFSFDAYRETGLNSAGQRTQTHYTYRLVDGEPSYDVVRSTFLDIATGKIEPLTSRSNTDGQ